MTTKTHGLSDTSIHNTWRQMRDRCNNPNNYSYKNYGGRGISVCAEWNEFEKFYADMGDRPSGKHSIERIENDKGYSKDNCKWATSQEQNLNHRMQKRNKSGFVGVGIHKQSGMWISYITMNKRQKHIGLFAHAIEAVMARNEYILKHGLPHKIQVTA